MNKFWLVWNGKYDAFPPKYRHASSIAARGEAERLAREIPGTEFYVLEVIGMARKVEVEYINFNEQEIPF